MTATEESAILRWLAHIGEDNPAMIAHVIEQCRIDPDKRAYYLRRSEEAPANVAGSPLRHDAGSHGCTHCAHRRGRADRHYGCVAREDLPPMYGAGHPLRGLPADGGTDCESFEAKANLVTWH